MERVGMQDPDVVQQADVCKRYGAEIHMPEVRSKLRLTQAQGEAQGARSSPYQRIAVFAMRRSFRTGFFTFSRALKDTWINGD